MAVIAFDFEKPLIELEQRILERERDTPDDEAGRARIAGGTGAQAERDLLPVDAVAARARCAPHRPPACHGLCEGRDDATSSSFTATATSPTTRP